MRVFSKYSKILGPFVKTIYLCYFHFYEITIHLSYMIYFHNLKISIEGDQNHYLYLFFKKALLLLFINQCLLHLHEYDHLLLILYEDQTIKLLQHYLVTLFLIFYLQFLSLVQAARKITFLLLKHISNYDL